MSNRMVKSFGVLAVALVLFACRGQAAPPEPGRAQAGGGAAPSSAPAPGAITDLLSTGEYALEVDGKEAKADFFHSDRAATFLIESPALPSPVVLVVRTQEAETASPAKITSMAGGSRVLEPDYKVQGLGEFKIDGEDVLFDVAGKHVKVKPRPPLLGPQTLATVRGFKPEYERNMKAYRPDEATVAVLKTLQAPVRVRVFFGSWCPHCTEFMPHIMRVEEELKGSKIAIEYYGLPPGAAMSQEPEAKRVGVVAVPTGIVYMAGREVGRISGEGWRAPEVALKDVISAAASGGP